MLSRGVCGRRPDLLLDMNILKTWWQCITPEKRVLQFSIYKIIITTRPFPRIKFSTMFLKIVQNSHIQAKTCSSKFSEKVHISSTWIGLSYRIVRRYYIELEIPSVQRYKKMQIHWLSLLVGHNEISEMIQKLVLCPRVPAFLVQ